MDTTQHNTMPQHESPVVGARRPRGMARSWRCFVGATVILSAFVALNLAGCSGGSSGLDSGFGSGGGNSIDAPASDTSTAGTISQDRSTDSTSSKVTIKVRDRNTGEQLPASTTVIIFPGTPTPEPSTTQPLAVRLSGNGYNRTKTITDGGAGGVFSGVPKGTYKVYVNGQRATPDVAVRKNESETVVVSPGLNVGTQLLSKITVTGRSLAVSNATPTAAPTAGVGTPTPTPTRNGSCAGNNPIPNNYLIRVVDFNRNQVVALFNKASGVPQFQITNIPLPVTRGKAISSTYYLEIFSDPDNQPSDFTFSGTSALFTLNPKGNQSISLPDICATTVSLTVTPTPVVTPTS